MDALRDINRVSDSSWIRSQMCAPNALTLQKNYLLRGLDEELLANFLCLSLNDSQLSRLFILVSSRLDISKVKKDIFTEYYTDFNFYQKFYKAIRAFNDIVRRLERSELSKIDLNVLFEMNSNLLQE